MKHRIFIIGLFIFYILVMTGLMVWQGIEISPDRYIFVLLLGSLFIKRTREFILDWIPFLFILISYDFLRSFSSKLTGEVHILDVLSLEHSIFGFIPTQVLQQYFFNPNHLHWYDYVATAFYFLHFALPVSFGYLLWVSNRGYFKRFVTAICLLSYSAWVTYVIYPSAPPWLAAKDGYLPGVVKILDYTLNSFSSQNHLSNILHNLTPSEVGAIPSAHAAYPFLVLLFAIRFFGLRGLWFLPYPIILWMSVIYLGEHYVLDIILGIIYAIIFYLITEKFFHRMNWDHLYNQLERKISSFTKNA